MSIRSLMLAGAAICALSFSAHAQNVVNTTQIGGANFSTTNQNGAYNSAFLAQTGFSNVGTANQGLGAPAVANASTTLQTGVFNTANTAQASGLGNASFIGQLSFFGANVANVGQATSPFGVNGSTVNQGHIP